MKTLFKRPLQCLPLLAVLATASTLWAQSTGTSESAEAAVVSPAVQIGDATHGLLQRQREGNEASATPRPIDGRVAELSQQRYLKSFEQPVPAWFGSRLEKK